MLSAYTPLTLTAAQCPAIHGDIDAALSHMLEVLDKAEQIKADIVCFPECYLTGYYHDKESIRQNALSLNSNKFTNILASLKNFSSTVIV